MGGFEVIDERYRGLYERAVAVLEADERVLEVQPSGSAGTGTADRCRDGLLAFGLGLAELLVTRVRPLDARYGRTWPADLAAVTAARVRDALSIHTTAWLH